MLYSYLGDSPTSEFNAGESPKRIQNTAKIEIKKYFNVKPSPTHESSAWALSYKLLTITCHSFVISHVHSI
jgi:hypothetical protein